MPQEKRRSISYRSFVTCDNPKGVIECGVIRKSKVNSHKKEHSFKVDNNNNNNVGEIKEMCIHEFTGELDISKGGGDDMMNHVTNSRSRVKGNEDDIAKTLLRGAFDLQESLVMLGKLQEDAFSRMRRKEKCRVEDGSFDCMVNSVSTVRPRKSTDEMKRAVKDCLLRQNMITNPIFEESFDHRMMGCSTSSSQSSSRIRSSNFVPSDCSSSSTVSQRRKKKESNLIVRLMGLESPPLSPRWLIEGDKIVNSPRARKGQFGAQVLSKKQKSVEEILENLHFKGLLKSDVFVPGNGVYDERPPIVIMKPMSCKTRDLDETVVPSSRSAVEKLVISSLGAHFVEEDRRSERRDAFSKVKSPKPQTKHEVPRKSSVVEKASASPSRRKAEESKGEQIRKDGRNVPKQQNVSSHTSVDCRKQEVCEILGQRRKDRHSALVEGNVKGKGKEKVIEVVSRDDDFICDDDNVLLVTKSVIIDSFPEQKQPRNKIRDHTVEASPKHRQNNKIPGCDIALADTHEHYIGYDDNHSCYSEIASVSTSEQYSPVCEVTLVTTHENGVPVNTLANKPPSLPYKSEPESSEERPPETPRTSLQMLLLSNPSFLNNLHKLFDIQVLPYPAPYNIGKDTVLIDYANEVLQLRSSEFSKSYSQKTRNIPSLGKLLEDIRSNIEGLKHYHGSPNDDNFSSDRLYHMLDRDLSYTNGLWEMNWKTMFSQDDRERVVREVDKFVLSKLIEEVVLDFTVLL